MMRIVPRVKKSRPNLAQIPCAPAYPHNNITKIKYFHTLFSSGLLSSALYLTCPCSSAGPKHLHTQYKSHRYHSMASYQFEPAERVRSFAPTVWHEFSPLATIHKAINLGQGFPDFDGPDFVLQAHKDAIGGGAALNQYTRSGGHPRLVKALAEFYSPLFNRQLLPLTEIAITVGASEALYASIQALVGSGDEIVVMEPVFDIYMGAITMSGATPKYVSLRPKPGVANPTSDDWVLEDMKEFEAAFSDKTKLFIINNPQNPTGKVFTRIELEEISQVVKKFRNVTVISDEVYEWMTFDGVEHVRIATLPGMWERTVTVGSSGKTFSVTGWKIGWTIGPNNIVQSIMNAHQYIPFSVSTPAQEAVAVAFEEAPKRNYFAQLKEMYQKKRDYLLQALINAGLDPVVPKGSYFIIADLSKIKLSGDEGKQKTVTGLRFDLHDWNLCRFLTTEVGVAAIPLSAFYSTEHQTITNYGRFCFCKTEPVLEEAAKRLGQIKKLKNYVPN